MLVRFHLTPAGWFWYLADEQAGPFTTYDEAVEHQRDWLDAPSPADFQKPLFEPRRPGRRATA
jgi:hypothetical protein